MDNHLITYWNLNVHEDDIIYHLGDFSFASAQPYLDRLNGYKLFVRGNHEKPLINAVGVNKVPYIRETKIDDISITLCHYAMRVWNKSHFDQYHLYGHSHGTLPPQGKSLDVGVDCNNFQPISWSEVKAKMDKQPHNFNWVKNLPGYNQEEFDKARQGEDE